MQVALLSIGDELLAGETTNTNAAWLAERISERGGDVRRILTLPDDRELIARYVGEWNERFDAVVVTGGLGGTPDDVTMEAVADGLDRELVVDEGERERLIGRLREFHRERPDLAEEYEFRMDLDLSASIPEGGRPLATDAGWAPGCAVENVYVLPGFPEEMKAMFELVVEEFDGERVSASFHTPAPEGSLYDALEGARERFEASVGSYPQKGTAPGRLKVTGTDPEEVEATIDWLKEHVEVAEPPVETPGTASDADE